MLSIKLVFFCDVAPHNLMKMRQQVLPKYWYSCSIVNGITSEITKLCEILYRLVSVFSHILVSISLKYQFLSIITKFICRTVEIKFPPPDMDSLMKTNDKHESSVWSTLQVEDLTSGRYRKLYLKRIVHLYVLFLSQVFKILKRFVYN